MWIIRVGSPGLHLTPPLCVRYGATLDGTIGLLRDTALGVAEVAHRVGYKSKEAFNRAFKRAMGTPLARWRWCAQSSSCGLISPATDVVSPTPDSNRVSSMFWRGVVAVS